MFALKKIFSVLVLMSILMSNNINYNCYGINNENILINCSKKYKKRKAKNWQKKEIDSFARYLIAKEDKSRRKNREI